MEFMDIDTNDTTYLQRGSSFDVSTFLSHNYYHRYTSNNCNDYECVDHRDLEGKVVMICCFSLPLQSSAVARALSLVSTELYDLGAFRLIVVLNLSRLTQHDDLSAAAVVSDFISLLPSFCLVVPLCDSDVVCKALNFPATSEPTGLLINRSQTVEWHKPLNFLLEYGVDAFPFTTERLAEISEREKNKVLWLSLLRFLCFDPLPFPKPTSFLGQNIGQRKKRINELQRNIVGLYLCQTGTLIPKLDMVHKECRDLGLEFEIILVYMPFKDFGDPQLFQDHINSSLKERNISWWVLPFCNWVSRRLWRLTHKGDDDRLIIIHPASKIVELHGEAVVRHLGINAYPFSRERLLNRELHRLRKVTLESLLVYGSQDFVLWKGSDFTERVPLTALQGKTVLLYLHCVEDHSSQYFDKLISYCQRKADDPDFEAVFVGLDAESLCYLEKSYRTMPLLVCPPDPKNSDFVTRKIFRKGGKCSTVVAFGKDGHIFYISAMQLVCSSCLDFPFSDHLGHEKSSELFEKELPFNLMPYCVSTTNFKALFPLLGKEYFFPDHPLGGRMKQPEVRDVCISADVDERDKYFASKVDFYGNLLNEVALYPNEIHGKIPDINTGKFDLVSFLSTNNRDYLVRNDSSYTRFQVGSLRDKKWVMICCFFCPMYSNGSDSLECRAVSNVCSELYEKYGDSFEMVLVFKMRGDFQADNPAFKHMLSGFPSSCLVVPFWDLHSRDSICCSLYVDSISDCSKGLFVHADTSEVIWHRELGYFVRYGVDTFPFTEEVFEKTEIEGYSKSWKRQSLEKLLCYSSETVLKKFQSSEVTSIKQLQKKLVGVYLCLDGDSIPILHELYTALNMELEIVVVYLPRKISNSDPQLFQKMINRALEKRKISWWVAPFQSWVSLRLNRLCCSPCEDELMIVGKGFVDPDGAKFLRKFKEATENYSFGRRVRKQKKVIDKFKSRYQLDPSSHDHKPYSRDGGRLKHKISY